MLAKVIRICTASYYDSPLDLSGVARFNDEQLSFTRVLHVHAQVKSTMYVLTP